MHIISGFYTHIIPGPCQHGVGLRQGRARPRPCVMKEIIIYIYNQDLANMAWAFAKGEHVPVRLFDLINSEFGPAAPGPGLRVFKPQARPRPCARVRARACVRACVRARCVV